MIKKILFLLILASLVYANEQQVEIYATTMDTKNNIIVAEGDVLVVYQNYIISAKKAIYNKNNSDLELFGNIKANEGIETKMLGDYAKMNIAKKERNFRPFYIEEQQSSAWISGKEGLGEESKINVKTGITSGCNPQDPLWKIEFSSSDYNTDSKWLNLYNARLYFGDIPVFYTPYFAYPLDTTRRSGLLLPSLGYSSAEGFYYEQPIYIAEQSWWDLELRPQIRTSRGSGLYSEFRFKDAHNSKGAFKFGSFKEKDEYYTLHDLQNQKHRGYSIFYDNEDVINNWFGTNYDAQSGLYIDVTDMNDVEYLNLSTNDVTQSVTSNQIISRANLFYNTDKHYFGAYGKYYKNLDSDSNEKTIQNIPSLHYHNYLNTFLDDHLLYSVDIKSNNLYREIGKNAIQTDINIPLSIQDSFFDEYLTLKYSTNLYAQHTTFSKKDEDKVVDKAFDDGLFLRNTHSISAFSQLTKAYDSFTHTIDFGTIYTQDGSSHEDGYYEKQRDFCQDKENSSSKICEFYNIQEVKKNLQLYFAQYIFRNDGSQLIYHRLAQSLSDKNFKDKGEIENELDLQISKSLNYYNNLFYNHDKKAISKSYNHLSYNNDGIGFSIAHMYRDTFLNKATKISYLTTGATYRYNNHYSYHFNYNYDLELKMKKGIEVGFLHERRCLDFGLIYVENNRPILRSSGKSDSLYDRVLYIIIRLKPFMAQQSDRRAGFVYRLPGE